jgi:NTF2-related export protein 1/2
MSILVSVSGYVRYGEGKDLPMRGFSENFVLVPGEDADKRKMRDRGKGGREWVIQSQNFRITV